MFKRFTKILVLILTLPVFVLAGCGKYRKSEGVDLFDGNTDFSVVASATSDKINLEISNVKKPKGYKKGQELDVIMLEPYEYYNGEADTGVNSVDASFEYSSGEKVGTYTVGKANTLSIDRYKGDKKNNVDLLYNKFVLAKSGKLVAGPFLVSNIESLRNYDEDVKMPETTEKGIVTHGFGDTNGIERGMLTDLGIGWTEFNVNPNTLMFPNEKPSRDSLGNPDPSNIIKIDNQDKVESGEAIEYVSNGVKYYFNASGIASLDEEVNFCYQNKMRVVFILYNHKDIDENWDWYPYFMVYPGTSYEEGDNTICSTDTSTEIGYGYYRAFMEFIAERYSREENDPNGFYGYVHRFVVGNEIDISWNWNPVLNYLKQQPLPIDEYVEEYLRTMRIAEQATKKYYGHSMVMCSTCHYWAGAREEFAAYPSKDIYDYLNSKASYEGNFDWGMASHPYPIDLPNYRYLYTEVEDEHISGDYNKTTFITWTNLEVIDLYLAQPQLMFNGKMRQVYYTEGGVSSGYTQRKTIQEPVQAAGIAYAYFKAVSLKSTGAFIYYDLKDYSDPNSTESFNVGLIRADYEKKPSYEMYKYIDTNYGMDVANLYLPSLYFKLNGVSWTYKNGKITSYRVIMDVIPSAFDWNAAWDESKLFPRTATEKPDILK